jgi:hypothetical protein
VGRRGRKRQLDLESEYWKPLQSGVGTVAACKLLGIGRGLHPAALAEGGLRPALKTLARRSAVPVRLDVGVEASAAGSCCTARPARAPPCR